MAYLGVAVCLLDRDAYSETEFNDLCQLSVTQAMETRLLQAMIADDRAKLLVNLAGLDMNDPSTRFQVETAKLEFEYIAALELLRLARWHQGDFYALGFHSGQTRAAMNDWVVWLTNEAVLLENKARRAGISVGYIQSMYM